MSPPKYSTEYHLPTDILCASEGGLPALSRAALAAASESSRRDGVGVRCGRAEDSAAATAVAWPARAALAASASPAPLTTGSASSPAALSVPIPLPWPTRLVAALRLCHALALPLVLFLAPSSAGACSGLPQASDALRACQDRFVVLPVPACVRAAWLPGLASPVLRPQLVHSGLLPVARLAARLLPLRLVLQPVPQLAWVLPLSLSRGQVLLLRLCAAQSYGS